MDELKDYEKLYKINKKGEIWSNYYNRMMTPTIGSAGYYNIEISKDGVVKQTTIHRLLAIQYLPNPNNLQMVDHIDQNKTNNCLENLRWASCRTNNLNMGKTPKSGHQNIYIDSYNQCIVNIHVNGIRYNKRFYELKDAIAYRDKIVEEFCD
jgi:hypothetical protein